MKNDQKRLLMFEKLLVHVLTDEEQLRKLKLQNTIAGTIKSDDKELIYDHSLLHAYWNKIHKGKKVENWDRGKIIRYHTAVVKEIIKRGFKHMYHGELDDTLPSDLKKETIKEDDIKTGDKRDKKK